MGLLLPELCSAFFIWSPHDWGLKGAPRPDDLGEPNIEDLGGELEPICLRAVLTAAESL